MVIGYDAKRAFNNTAGLGNYSRYIIDSVAKINPEIKQVLFTPKISKQYQAYAKGKVLVKPTGFDKIIPSLWRSKTCVKDLLKNKISLYHGLSNELPYGIEQSGIKTVVTVHDLIFKRFPEFYKNPLDIKTYDKKFEHACRIADKIIAISEQTKVDIVEFYQVNPSKISVIYQDCDASFHQKVSDEKKWKIKVKYHLPNRFVLSVGTIEKRKNQVNTVEAFAKIKEADLHLVLIGKPTEYQEEVIKTAEKLHIRQRVHIINCADFLDFPAIYQQAQAMVYISHFEGFGIPILEALNSRLPIVTSTGSCFREVGEDATLYADPNNVEVIAQQLQKALFDTETRKFLIEKTISQAKKFRYDQTIPKLIDVYKEVAVHLF